MEEKAICAVGDDSQSIYSLEELISIIYCLSLEIFLLKW